MKQEIRFVYNNKESQKNSDLNKIGKIVILKPGIFYFLKSFYQKIRNIIS